MYATRSGHFGRSPLSAVACCLMLLVCSCTRDNQNPRGTSAVVLIDFSKSFAPLTRSDQQALENTAAAIGELAEHRWTGPVTVLWSGIETSSLTARSVCGPFELRQSLVKRSGEDTQKSFADNLRRCPEAAIQRGTSALSSHTDISGSIALATDYARSSDAGRYLVILSDFVEDLPVDRGGAADFRLRGERVLLLHRQAAQVPQVSLAESLQFASAWKARLIKAGASSVAMVPIAAATRERVKRALQGVQGGTGIAVVQNLPDTAPAAAVDVVGGFLSAEMSRFPSPVAVTWADARPAGAMPVQLPTVELVQKLVKPASENAPGESFAARINECAEGMKRFAPGSDPADVLGLMTYYASSNEVDKERVMIVLSSFPALPSEAPIPSTISGWKIIMVAGPRSSDALNQRGYQERIERWERELQRHGASVCRVPLNALTKSSLARCMQ